jgi:hypothetical protein
MLKHLNLLATLHLIYGLLQLVFGGLLGLGVLGFGIVMLIASDGFRDDEATVMGIAFTAGGLVGLVVAVGLGLVFIAASRTLRNRTGRTLPLVAAVLAIPSGLIGIALAVFTFMVLADDEVKAEIAVNRG